VLRLFSQSYRFSVARYPNAGLRRPCERIKWENAKNVVKRVGEELGIDRECL
jgi:hypothetical protein